MFLVCKNICWSLFFFIFYFKSPLCSGWCIAWSIPELMVNVLECDGYLITYAWAQVNIWRRRRTTHDVICVAFSSLLFSSLLCCCCCRLSAMSDWKEATSRWQSPDNRNRQKKLCTWLHPLFTPVIILLFKKIINKNRTNFKSNFTLK